MKINIEIEKSRAEELEKQRQELQLKMDAINKEMAKMKHGDINAILDETAAKLEKGQFIQIGSQFGKVETWKVNHAKDRFFGNPNIEIVISDFVSIYGSDDYSSVNTKDVSEIHFQVNSKIEVLEELIFITESRHAAVKEFALQVIGSIERVLNAGDKKSKEEPVYSCYNEWFSEFKKEVRALEYYGPIDFLSFTDDCDKKITPKDAAKSFVEEMNS